MFILSKQYFKTYNLSERKYSAKDKRDNFYVSEMLQDFKIQVIFEFFTRCEIEICKLPVRTVCSLILSEEFDNTSAIFHI